VAAAADLRMQASLPTRPGARRTAQEVRLTRACRRRPVSATTTAV